MEIFSDIIETIGSLGGAIVSVIVAIAVIARGASRVNKAPKKPLRQAPLQQTIEKPAKKEKPRFIPDNRIPDEVQDGLAEIVGQLVPGLSFFLDSEQEKKKELEKKEEPEKPKKKPAQRKRRAPAMGEATEGMAYTGLQYEGLQYEGLTTEFAASYQGPGGIASQVEARHLQPMRVTESRSHPVRLPGIGLCVDAKSLRQGMVLKEILVILNDAAGQME